MTEDSQPDRPAPTSPFESVRWVDWSALVVPLGDPAKPFCEDVWCDLRPHIEQIADSDQRLFAELVHSVLSFHLKAACDPPYGPKLTFGDGRRTLVPSDLPISAIECLNSSWDTCPHVDLKARIADVIWIAARHHPSLKRRRFELARAAVELLLRVAMHSLGDDYKDQIRWVPGRDRLERAARLGLELSNPETASAVGRWMDEVLASRRGSELEFISRDLHQLQLEHGYAKPEIVCAATYGLGEQIYANGKPELAQSYFDLSLRAAARTNDAGQIKSRHRRCAECHLAISKSYLAASPEAWAPASSHLSSALNHLRLSGADKSELDVVQRDLHAQQEKGMKSCASFEHTFDFSDQAKQLGDYFESHDLPESIRLFLCGIHRPRNYQENRREIARKTADHPMLMLMPVSRMSFDGRVEANISGVDKDDEVAVKRMLFEVAQNQQLHGMLFRVARRVFQEYHPMDYGACEQMAIESPLVPRDRIWSVARGIYRGWRGEWIECLHVLLPQLENIIRSILLDKGIVLTKPNPDQQDYIDLGGMLSQHEQLLGQVLGEGEVLALRAACTERSGLNRRNDLAHGLIPDGDFGKHSDVYLWWLFQRILLASVIAPSEAHSRSPESNGPMRQNEANTSTK